MSPFGSRGRGRRPEPSRAASAALEDLDRLVVKTPGLSAPSQVLRKALPILFPSRTPAVCAVRITPDQVAEAARACLPVLEIAPPTWDDDLIRQRGLAVCRVLAGELPGIEGFQRLAVNREPFEAWADAILHRRFEWIEAAAVDHRLDPHQASALLRLCLLPTLASWSAQLDVIRPESLWAFGTCPDCGHEPILAESRGLEGRRFLRCGFCAGSWPVGRLQCPSCRGEDPQRLRYLVIEAEAAERRLLICDTCGTKLVVISVLEALSPPALLVAELASLPLQLAASTQV